MAESFLEEQLRRIREMTEQMSRVGKQTRLASLEIEREREALRHGPLQDIRDFRTYSATGDDERPRRADDDVATRRRHTPRNPARRRR